MEEEICMLTWSVRRHFWVAGGICYCLEVVGTGFGVGDYGDGARAPVFLGRWWWSVVVDLSCREVDWGDVKSVSVARDDEGDAGVANGGGEAIAGDGDNKHMY